MRKIAITLALAGLLAILGSQDTLAGTKSAKGPASNRPVMLIDSVTVNSTIIRLGDVFTNTGNKSEIAIAYAPGPGQTATLDANWLYRVANAYKLKWRPLSVQEHVIVQRESVVITREEIEDRILVALIDKGADPKSKVELSNRLMRIHVAGGLSATIKVEDVIFEPRMKRFTAVLVATGSSTKAQRTRVTGRVHKILDVPVLSSRLKPGDIIRKHHVKWIKVRAERLQRDIILNEAGLVGMASKRGLLAETPLRNSDVRRPILVAKNSLVTLELAMPFMNLTAQGKALEDGARGDTVRIHNSRSKNIVEGVVVGDGKVRVHMAKRVALN
ncbi:MAG: flagellar basal body P-ring formation protein FlgA [Rhodospirillaceae bacterium]|jgi:flagellar basal body P-ring formation protein FlgA|nr:flagellar basal body P-ring formation protein FlgA [Rhodospirillales bacterium]MBT3906603.1 flagellar basal body P-ring formation protein FlgA [Rhodospirillaceae bacterium]MBT4703190.1 flagellar basal body P-ring formation protein FlgA [Rhodospirillaceae bacterium]MBT5033203.1 flagellar basal body P-ring formation protein FlgA [Rhodospirillaceae bacterium]MBT6219026.1 flagellar basal body P-ring formation protein FlgA [Rhodospirillaceae bacterium]